MLSETVKAMAKQWLDLGFELDGSIRAETGDALGLYVQDWLHVIANSGYKLTKEQVEDIVGPITFSCATEDNNHYALCLAT